MERSRRGAGAALCGARAHPVTTTQSRGCAAHDLPSPARLCRSLGGDGTRRVKPAGLGPSSEMPAVAARARPSCLRPRVEARRLASGLTCAREGEQSFCLVPLLSAHNHDMTGPGCVVPFSSRSRWVTKAESAAAIITLVEALQTLLPRPSEPAQRENNRPKQ